MAKNSKGSHSTKGDGTTPLMRQYNDIKSKYPDALLLFRVGDFYETFGEDAVKVASILGIVLTSRNNGGNDVELAGFPYHSLDIYLPRLVKEGYRVAICDQLEKPSKEKKIVARGVTNVITPGLTLDDSILHSKANNYLCAIHIERENEFGVSFLDLSTGEFMIAEGNQTVIESLFQRFQPAEIIFSKKDKRKILDIIKDQWPVFHIDDWVFVHETSYNKLLNHFKVSSLKGFGIDSMNSGQIAAGAILHYIEMNQNKEISHINKITKIPQEDYMWLDRFTIQNLELVTELHSEGRSLVDVLDHCSTPMGTRMMRKWILLPLLSESMINSRLNIVEYLLSHKELCIQISSFLKQIGDLERLISKSAMGKIQPRETLHIKKALLSSHNVQLLLHETQVEDLITMSELINPCHHLISSIEDTIKEEAPTLVMKGNFIKDGVDETLDEYRYLVKNAKQVMQEVLDKETESSGIPNLKLGFNNVFGYYFEVTARHKYITPPETWIRKQTLANAERYITEELKELEVKILHAENAMQEIEEALYVQLIIKINEYIENIQATCAQLGRLDCLLSFAHQARMLDYNRPEFNDEGIIEIIQGRHPIIESMMGHDKTYIPNDLLLDQKSQQIIILTGPNMAGKSAVLRQTGLIALMSQIGSYVPAKKAKLSIVDKLFTRVGASDNISGGESTFMVEMNETASIMNNLTDKSLILLDEIGRGTATYDGISIAWALAEFLHDNEAGKPKTLFATHYHELNELTHKLERIKNFNVAVKETKDKVIFLYKLVEGGSEHSFGIHVAKMAGMPQRVIDRSNEIMHQLEEKSIALSGSSKKQTKEILSALKAPVYQLSIFETDDPSIGEIRNILLELQPELMTPIDCLIKLKELQELVQKSLLDSL